MPLLTLVAPALDPVTLGAIERYVRAASESGTIADGSVTLAKLADVATGTVFYRKTAGTGVPEVQTLATLKTDLGLTGTNSGDQTSIVGISGTMAQFNAAITDGDIGTGTVTSVSVTTAAGVSGSVATATTTPAITISLGAITPTSIVTGAITSTAGITSSSASAGIGYATGAGGVVTQGASKSTTAVLNAICGTVTMNAAALAAGAIVTFQLTNNTVVATDNVIINHSATGTFGAYLLNARCLAGAISISIRNTTAGSLSEAIQLRFTVIKTVTS